MKTDYFKITLLLCLLCVAACSDKNDLTTSGPAWEQEEMEADPGGQLCCIRMKAASGWTVSCDDNWVRLYSTIGEGEATLSFYVAPNETDKMRNACIRLQGEGGTANLTVSQKPTPINDENTDYDPFLFGSCHLGYGYNIYGYNQRVSSTMKQVFDARSAAYTTIPRHDEMWEFYEGYSYEELSNSYSKGDTTTMGLKHIAVLEVIEIDDYFKKTAGSLCFGQGKFLRILSTSQIDMGDVLYDEDEDLNTLFFTSNFLEYYERVRNSPTDENIDAMLHLYGTHVVTSVDVGGMMECTLAFDQKQVSELETCIKSETLYLFDEDIKNQSVTSQNARVYYTGDGNRNLIRVSGGTKQAREALMNDAVSMKIGDKLTESKITAWANSLTTAGAEHAVVGVDLIPIWKLFRKEKVRESILKRVKAFGKGQGFRMPQRNGRLYRWKMSEAESALAYKNCCAKNKFVACKEFVPALNEASKIILYYADGNLTRGVYPGDGKLIPPSYVSFTVDNEQHTTNVAVTAISGYKVGDRLTELWINDLSGELVVPSKEDERAATNAYGSVQEYKTGYTKVGARFYRTEQHKYGNRDLANESDLKLLVNYLGDVIYVNHALGLSYTANGYTFYVKEGCYNVFRPKTVVRGNSFTANDLFVVSK